MTLITGIAVPSFRRVGGRRYSYISNKQIPTLGEIDYGGRHKVQFVTTEVKTYEVKKVVEFWAKDEESNDQELN